MLEEQQHEQYCDVEPLHAPQLPKLPFEQVRERVCASELHAPSGAVAAYLVRDSVWTPPCVCVAHPVLQLACVYVSDHAPQSKLPLLHVPDRICVSDVHAPSGAVAAYLTRLSVSVPPCGVPPQAGGGGEGGGGGDGGGE